MPLTYKYFWSTLNYKKIPFWTKKKMCLNIFSSHSCMRTYSIFRNNFIPLHVTFVTNAVLKSLTWTNMCQQFMKERKHSNVKFVTSSMKYHIKSVHEDRKESKCNICDYSTNLKSNMTRLICNKSFFFEWWHEKTCCISSWGKETIPK